MAAPLVLSCAVEDYNTSTGECAAPYYASAPSLIPPLTAVEGLKISFAIVGIWTVGLIARLLIRAAQQESK